MLRNHDGHFFKSSAEKPRKKVYDIINGDSNQITAKKREIEQHYQNCHAWKEAETKLDNGIRLTFVKDDGANLQVEPTVYDFSMVVQGKGIK